MNKIILIVLFLIAAFDSIPAQKNAAAERKVEFHSYANARYFERNDSNLMGDSSYLVFNSLEKFEQIFGYATISGDNHFMPENVFNSKLIIAMIKRGQSIYKYDLKKVTVKNKKLYVWYAVAPEDQEAAKKKARDDGLYSYATTCFLTVDKNKYSEVIFMENGKRAGTVSVIQNKPEMAPETVIKNLYATQKNPKTSQFFQTKNRALLDRYFVAESLGERIWKDAAKGKAAAINFNPLFGSQAQTVAFTISSEQILGDSNNAWVIVKFKNSGKAEEVNFEMRWDTGTKNWKIANIHYSDRGDLAALLRYSQDAEYRDEHDDYNAASMIFNGAFLAGAVECAFTPLGRDRYRFKCADQNDYQISVIVGNGEYAVDSIEINGERFERGSFVLFEHDNDNFLFRDASGKQIEFKRIQKTGESCCKDAKTVMEIVYQFSNGPVSPEYQRNYTVTLNKANAKLRFQSYGKEQPTEITVKTGDAKFKEIMELAGKIEIRKDRIKKNEGCTGGSSESLKVSNAKKTETFSAYVYHCGGTDYGNLTGDTKLLKTQIIALFPNEEYLK